MPDPITRNSAGLFVVPQDTPEGWVAYVNANWDTIAFVSAVGGLAVQPRDLDANLQSNSLYVIVSAGDYGQSAGPVANYPGSAGLAVPASATTCLWLTDAGVLTTGAAFPATVHVRLARVTTDATKVTGITDARVSTAARGTPGAYALKTGDTFTGTLFVGAGATFRADPVAGTVGFFGSAGATQAAAVAVLTDSSTGVAGANIPDVGTAYNQATLNNIHASLSAKINALIAAVKRHGLVAP
jgi:hypothetical protein